MFIFRLFLTSLLLTAVIFVSLLKGNISRVYFGGHATILWRINNVEHDWILKCTDNHNMTIIDESDLGTLLHGPADMGTTQAVKVLTNSQGKAVGLTLTVYNVTPANTGTFGCFQPGIWDMNGTIFMWGMGFALLFSYINSVKIYVLNTWELYR